MRRANGSGAIFKIKGKNRRKPWRVRITIDWILDPATQKCKQVVKTLGYYSTRQEAEAALVSYNNRPYGLETQNMTFKELYELWTKEYFQQLSGVSSCRTIEAAYKYSHSLYNMRVRDIRVGHLRECMENAYIISERGADKGKKRVASAGSKARMKSMFNLMFDFACADGILR